MKYLLSIAATVVALTGFSQMQTCPANINFNAGDLSFWSVTTGLMGGATQSYPAPNSGLTTVPEYTIGNTGIHGSTSKIFNKPYKF
jgi:hypothetical protein